MACASLAHYASSWHAAPANSPDCEILESDHFWPCAPIEGASLASVLAPLGDEILLSAAYVLLGHSLFGWVERQSICGGKLEGFQEACETSVTLTPSPD